MSKNQVGLVSISFFSVHIRQAVGALFTDLMTEALREFPVLYTFLSMLNYEGSATSYQALVNDLVFNSFGCR